VISPLRQGLIAVHVIAGVAVIALLCRHLGTRAQEVHEVREAAATEHETTVHAQREIARMDELRKGVERQDPYVIELLAREKLGYGRAGEITPPPAPTAPAAQGPSPTSDAPTTMQAGLR
jgi:hypothetical protein